ncbi:methyltransferase domain-containing protein [Haloferula sp. BvORR071]|uniref:class I SAM-dependent methyltransferase n=1 Tax=Haloferula sp. BvORR071 TaxID=1396141 RepID=UPI000695D833|nr:methyltransferase domain-containing protein [Haloferula sp. BvORR071]
MEPSETADHYDQIARWWQGNVPPTYGLAALERALRFAKKEGASLDVGCGSEGRFMKVQRAHGFAPEGLDVSPAMVELARERDPEAVFYTADVSTWEVPRKYVFISAWDSTFHLPLDLQEPVLRKLCAALGPAGVILFTCGGGEAGEIKGSFQGQDFEYSTLGVEAFVRILDECGCFCRHLEYDQYPEGHVVIIGARKAN